jgi:DNA-binding NtrC family response regulator
MMSDPMSTPKARILIVDDEPTKRSVLEEELSAAGYSVVTTANPLEAAKELAKSAFEAVVTDIRMPGQDGLSFLRDLKRQNPTQDVILMTAYGSVETAVEAMKLGAFDYLQKPFSTEELLLKLDKLLQYKQMASENEALHHELALPRIENKIVGQSEAMREALRRIHAAAASETTVLIEGERGTGKELIARTIHEHSRRLAGPFVAISCAALPKNLLESELFGREPGAFPGDTKRLAGHFELARGGTIFLDDVDALRLEVQAKLVRVLQDRACKRVRGNLPIPVDVRLIVATEQSLSALVVMGRFQEGLFRRLSVVWVKVPPLRERVQDIPLLVEHFLKKFSVVNDRKRLTIAPEALTKLQRYSWPGNVRELERQLETMVVLCKGDRLEAGDVPDPPASNESGPLLSLRLTGIERVDAGSILEDLEDRLIHWALEKAEGNIDRAAEMLSLPSSTLLDKISRRSTQGSA